MLHPARDPTGGEVRDLLRRLLSAGSHYCAPEVLDFCRTERVDFILCVATTRTLRLNLETLEHGTAARQAVGCAADKLRRHKEFHDSAASWSRVERIGHRHFDQIFEHVRAFRRWWRTNCGH
ncbi:MAG: hypothetical protein EBX37_01580 [Alphaproteobacteria bacterium]|nr:hypothetical protein [Alphaproteobacteria bacterium]